MRWAYMCMMRLLQVKWEIVDVIRNVDLQRAITNVPCRNLESVGWLHRNPWFPVLVFMAPSSHPSRPDSSFLHHSSNFRFSSCCPSSFYSLQFLVFHRHFLLSLFVINSFFLLLCKYRTKQIRIQFLLMQFKNVIVFKRQYYVKQLTETSFLL